MKNEIGSVFLFLAACSSQVSLGSEDEHVAGHDAGRLGRRAVQATTRTLDRRAVDRRASTPPTHRRMLRTTIPARAKACATPCTVCDPHDATCVEPPGSKQCNAHQQCVTTPICP